MQQLASSIMEEMGTKEGCNMEQVRQVLEVQQRVLKSMEVASRNRGIRKASGLVRRYFNRMKR